MRLAGESWNVAESGKLFARVLGMHLEQLYCVESMLWQLMQASYVSIGFRFAKMKSCQVGVTHIREHNRAGIVAEDKSLRRSKRPEENGLVHQQRCTSA